MKSIELMRTESVSITSEQSNEPQPERVIACDRCLAPARVHVLEGYRSGVPLRRHYCFSCADETPMNTPPISMEHVRSRLSIASMLLFAGVVLVILGISVDQIGYHGSTGFGWKQTVSLAFGVFCVAIGALLHADLVAILGSIVFGIAVSADLYGPVGAPGFGWRQSAVVLLGALMIGIGLHRRRRGLTRQLTERDAEA